MEELKSLRPKSNEYFGLETIKLGNSVDRVIYYSDELYGNCPVTGQPDKYDVQIELTTGKETRGLESKSLKLYLLTFKDVGVFCEDIADQIAKDVREATKAAVVQVIVTQKRRGGIVIQAVSTTYTYEE